MKEESIRSFSEELYYFLVVSSSPTYDPPSSWYPKNYWYHTPKVKALLIAKHLQTKLRKVPRVASDETEK